MNKPTFLFHITCNIHDVKYEGIAEIPGKDGKIWYSHVTITPKNRNGDVFETRTAFYKIVDSPVVSTEDERYLGPLRKIERYRHERTGHDMIHAEDPYLDGEFILGEIYQETDEWIDLIIRSSDFRTGHCRFLKV